MSPTRGSADSSACQATSPPPAVGGLGSPHRLRSRDAHNIGTSDHMVAKPAITMCFCLVIITAANLAQHTYHPPLSLCETEAAKRFGTASWRAIFDPWQADADGERRWTPAHEVRLQEFSGKWVYLSCITIFMHWLYFACSLIAELVAHGGSSGSAGGSSGSAGAGRFAAAVYGACPIVNGLVSVTMMLYCIMWFVATFFIPDWKAQWRFFMAHGYPQFGYLMGLLHLPSLACVPIDVIAKDATLLEAHAPSPRTLFAVVMAFNVAYHIWLATNYYMCDGAIPYPWYYDIAIMAYPKVGFAFYGVFVTGMLLSVVLGLRRVIARRAISNAKRAH